MPRPTPEPKIAVSTHDPAVRRSGAASPWATAQEEYAAAMLPRDVKHAADLCRVNVSFNQPLRLSHETAIPTAARPARAPVG